MAIAIHRRLPESGYSSCKQTTAQTSGCSAITESTTLYQFDMKHRIYSDSQCRHDRQHTLPTVLIMAPVNHYCPLCRVLTCVSGLDFNILERGCFVAFLALPSKLSRVVVILFMTTKAVFRKFDFVLHRLGVTSQAVKSFMSAIKRVVSLLVMIEAPDEPVCCTMA